MTSYVAVIEFMLNNEPKTILLDSIGNTNVAGSSNVTTQPIVSGDEVSDHMFKQPSTMNLSGTCSLNGSKGIMIDSQGMKLEYFEDIFETINKQGILCNVYKISTDNNKDIRFKQRRNMILQSYNWVEKINSVDFSLAFREVLMTDIVQYNVDTDDEFLPNVTEPATLSFTNTLIDWNKIDASVIEILEKEGLWTTAFKTFISSMGEPALASVLLGAAGVAVAAIAIALASNPVGWVIAGAGMVIAAGYILVKGIINAIQEAIRRRKYAIERFEYYNNAEKDKQEAERFADFIYSIHQSFENINSLIHVYQISQSTAQECMLTIGNDYYIFTFSKNNVDGKYSLIIKDINDKTIKTISDVSSALESFDQATSSNYIMKANNNSRVYLFCPSEDKDDLTNYFVAACDFNVDEYNKLIEDIIASHIYNNK